MTIGEISMHHFWVFPVHLTLCVAGSGSVPETPRAPWIWFWLLRYNEGAGAWLLRGRVAALQPWPCPNPGKPIPSSLLPRSRLLCWGWKQEQYLLLSEQAGQWAQFNLHSSGLAQEYLHLIGSLVLFLYTCWQKLVNDLNTKLRENTDMECESAASRQEGIHWLSCGKRKWSNEKTCW